MATESSADRFSFRDPRLQMTLVGRFFVRIVAAATHLLLAAVTATLLASDIPHLFWIGFLLLLVLLDRITHWREADRPLDELPVDGAVNLAHYIDPRTFRAIEHAYDRSIVLRHDPALELTVQLLSQLEVKEALRRLDVSLDEFQQKAEELFASLPGEKPLSRTERLTSFSASIIAALPPAIQNHERFIGSGALFVGLASMENERTKRLFAAFTLSADDVLQAVLFGIVKHRGIHLRRRTPTHRTVNRSWTSKPTFELDAHGTDFTDLARTGSIGFLVGHAKEYEELVDVLSRPTNPNVLLVGEPGVGKESIVARLAHAIAHDDVPTALFDKRLVELRIPSLVAGAEGGVLQKRLQAIIDEIVASGNIILYIPDIHNLVRTSGTSYLSAADALTPIFMNNAFPVIGSTYPREFVHDIEPRTDLASIFDVIRVQEISESEAETILIHRLVELEAEHRVEASFGAVKTAVHTAKKYMHAKLLPSSAEELLKEAIVIAERRRERAVGPADIIRVAEEKTQVPIHEATSDEAKSLLELERTLHAEVIGQDEAVKAVSDALREYRAGISRKGGPIASFLFVGPTGVGKTQLAKALAKTQFGSEAAMVRFDMTEYQEKATISRFIGSPDASVTGALTEAVIHQPYSLVLLDEFEKAHPDIFNLFLQVLDDGRLTDGLGRTVDFTNAIVIATSNAKSDLMNEALGKGQSMSEIADYVKTRLTDVFKPELLNRFSRIIVFRDLKLDEVGAVARLNLESLAESVAEQGIELEFDPAAVTQVAKLGYDPAFGARPLRRVIDDKLRAPLAEAILTKKIQHGMRARLTVNDKGEFEFVPL